MNTNTQPSEYAMRAAGIISHQWTNSDVEDDALVIDQVLALAVAEATIKHESAVIDLRCQLAERDKRIAELEALLKQETSDHAKEEEALVGRIQYRGEHIAELDKVLATTDDYINQMLHGDAELTHGQLETWRASIYAARKRGSHE